MTSSVESLRGEHALVVYIDLKSPYAFIAIDPTRAMAKARGVVIDWRPFTLDIPSYLGSARVDRQRRVTSSNRSAEQWTGVRYAYRDARRYASLSGKTLRGTEKIWDSSLAGIAMLWAKKQGPGLLDKFLDAAYLAFWRRDLDIEDVDVLAQVLQSVGVDVGSFADYVANEGRNEHDELNQKAFDAGVYGVPTYLVGDEKWFGREHLPRLQWLLEGEPGDAPDVANRSFAQNDTKAELNVPLERKSAEDVEPKLTVVLDIRYPHAYLALDPAIRLGREHGLMIDWLPFSAPSLKPPVPASDGDDRSVRHRRLRAEAIAREVSTYADRQGLELSVLYRAGESEYLNLGWLWMREQHREKLVAFLLEAFRAYWAGQLDPANVAEVEALMARLDGTLDLEAFRAWCRGQGPESLAAVTEDLRGRGVFAVPTYLLDDEVFLGRQHLPMLGWLLEGRSNAIPI